MLCIPAGARHNIRNTGTDPMKLLSIYAPPQHAAGTIHRTKDEALGAEALEPFATWGYPNDSGEVPAMAESIYRVTQVIGTSTESWEAAVKNAVETAAMTVRDLRVGEIVKLDVTIDDGKVSAYRARGDVSFKYESEG